MSPLTRCTPALLALACTASPAHVPTHAFMPSPADGIPVVQPNDNREPAGTLENGVLTLKLVAMNARWYPEDPEGANAEMVALAEEGKAPQIPSPLIRVPKGTMIDATIRNSLSDSTIWVHWLATHPLSGDDSVAIPPGASHAFRFEAGEPGTYMYRVTPGIPDWDVLEREQMVGALIVDEPGPRPDDRVFVLNIWSQPPDSAAGIPPREALAINGRSWPWTERQEAATGDTLRWRVVNGTIRNHPMHLHGFYFRVDARGTSLRDTSYTAAQQRLAVTEDMSSFSTMAMTWVPERPGNWLLHCHLAFHVVPEARLEQVPAHTHSSDPRQHMAGLVMGIAVRPGAGYRDVARDNVRSINLFIDEGKPVRKSPRALGYVQQHGPNAPAVDSVVIPGAPLVLNRGVPTDITVTNRLRESSAVHWHGIELESFSDGVAGWSGAVNRVAPAIAPGKTFKARLTLPRAGTFIYHTHMNDVEQITSGLYGAIVVLEPGKEFDPGSDHVYVAGWDGDGEGREPFVVNGDSIAPPKLLRAGMPQRLRFVNIGPAQRFFFELHRDGAVTQWTPVAKDGADLPPHQAVQGRAIRRLGVGETFDATFTPEPGEYVVVVRLPVNAQFNGETIFRQRLIVP
ncbi:MAG TPA: multicopper oxidase domain-containing protein [Longimicrobiales bacterium]